VSERGERDAAPAPEHPAEDAIGACLPRPPRGRSAAQLRTLGDRLLHAQRSLRVLDAVRWDEGVERAFFAAGARQPPPVGVDYYARHPLPFDPAAMRDELRGIEAEVCRRLGGHPAGRILTRTCRECRQVVELLLHRGTRHFARIAAGLYAAPGEGPSPDWDPRLVNTLGALANGMGEEEEPTLDAAEAARLLSERLGEYFGAAGVRVRVSECLAADSAAGGGTLKVRAASRLTRRDVRLLEVHEGWVHLGTTLNARRQPVCSFLAGCSPSATLTQEGLAVATEVLAGAAHPARLRRLVHRVQAVARAQQGAGFLDVYRFFLEEGYAPREAYRHTARVFRGSLPEGCGPFAKDLCYARGFLLVWDFLHAALGTNTPRDLHLLFCGKTRLGDADDLAELAAEGLLAPPRYVPPPFADPARLGERLRSVAGAADLT
jgi:uncharacterized protein (TIGR02421 family)